MCAVKWMLGLSCPGCGLLHALWAAVQLHWEEAFRVFPIWPLVLVFFLFLRRSRLAGKVFIGLLLGQWILLRGGFS